MFIDDDELDPLEVARRAQKHIHEPTWKIADLKTGVITVIDVNEERVLYQSETQPRDRARTNHRRVVSRDQCA